MDCLLHYHDPALSTLDFDLKREPVIAGGNSEFVNDCEIFGFPTRAWATVLHYDKARSIARHIQNHRPGTSEATGCLRTRDEWATWERRYRSRGGRRIRSAGSAFLSEIVAAHKAGLIDVPELKSSRLTVSDKLSWLSSLGCGEFTRAQWDHLSKKSRQESVLFDANLDEIEAFLLSLEGDVDGAWGGSND